MSNHVCVYNEYLCECIHLDACTCMNMHESVIMSVSVCVGLMSGSVGRSIDTHRPSVIDSIDTHRIHLLILHTSY